MVDDCLNDKDQSRFLKGLQSFESSVKKSTGISFLSMSQVDRATTLNDILNATDTSIENEIKYFVSIRTYHL